MSGVRQKVDSTASAGEFMADMGCCRIKFVFGLIVIAAIDAELWQ